MTEHEPQSDPVPADECQTWDGRLDDFVLDALLPVRPDARGAPRQPAPSRGHNISADDPRYTDVEHTDNLPRYRRGRPAIEPPVRFRSRRERRDVAKAMGFYHPPWNVWWRLRVLRAKVWHWRRNGHQWL